MLHGDSCWSVDRIHMFLVVVFRLSLLRKRRCLCGVSPIRITGLGSESGSPPGGSSHRARCAIKKATL